VICVWRPCRQVRGSELATTRDGNSKLQRLFEAGLQTGADVHPRRGKGTNRQYICLARHPFSVMSLFCISPNNFSLSISHLDHPSWLQHLKVGQISRTPRPRSISETRTSLGMTLSLGS
jgi:hypothetical protein